MKVGTDAILLGAWAGLGAQNPTSILDIGTGTGVIALMVAQRFPSATVTAIDVDEAAADEAKENCRRSLWTDRCLAKRCPIQEFKEGSFDLIVSNPPWFQDSLKPDGTSRTTARHDQSLSFSDLNSAAARLLSLSGRFAVVIPFHDGGQFCVDAAARELVCNRRTAVRPTPKHPAKRLLLEFTRDNSGHCEESEITVENRRHEYTKEYAELTKAFLLRSPQFL